MEKKKVDTTNAGMANRSGYDKVLQKIAEGGYCPFCEEYFLKNHTKPILRRGEHWLVTENFRPYEGSTKHFLIVCLTHIERIEDMTAGMALEVFEHYNWLCKEYGLTGATLLFRSGDTDMTGGTVNHLHYQVIVGIKRRRNDSEVLKAVVGFKADR